MQIPGPAGEESLEQGAIAREQHELGAVAVGPALHGGWRRSEQMDLGGIRAFGQGACLAQEGHGLVGERGLGAEQDQMGEGRKLGGLAFLQGGRGESGVAVA